MPDLPRVRFTFDDGVVFEGFAKGTTWNGFDDVKVTPEVLDAVRAHFADVEPTLEDEYWPSVGQDGLVDLGGGFATVIVRRYEL